MHVVNQFDQDVMLLGHQRHSLFFEFREGDHGRRQRNVSVVFEFGTGFLNLSGELLLFLFTASILGVGNGFAGFGGGLFAGIRHFPSGFFAGIGNLRSCQFGRLSGLLRQRCDAISGCSESLGEGLGRGSWRERVFGHARWTHRI